MSAEDADYLDALLARQHAILTGVADAFRGDPGPLASHSHHDLAERAAATVAEVETLRRTLALAQESLAAASSGRRVTVVDEIERLQRERDAAHAAIADLRQEIGDAADTLHRLSLAQQRLASAGDRGAWATSGAYARAAQIVAGIGDPAARAAIGGATMRRDLPAVAVVVCPACGYGITADLDDGAYVTRRHSRREPARVGAGEIVWCGGGIVRP